MTLNWIAPEQPLCSRGSWKASRFTEEQREMKQVNRCLELCWQTTRSGPVQAKAAFRTCLLILREAKYNASLHSFFIHRLPSYAFIRVTQTILGRSSSSGVQLHGCCEEYAGHLTDEITWICSALDSSLEAGSVEAARACIVVCGEFNALGATSPQLAPLCGSSMVLLAGSGCLGRDLRFGLGDGLFLFPLKEAVVGLLLKGSSLSQSCLDNFHPSPFRAGVEKWPHCSFSGLWMKLLIRRLG